jgi:hypothetical protein
MARYNAEDAVWECECGSIRWEQEVDATHEVWLDAIGSEIDSNNIDADYGPVYCGRCCKPFENEGEL